MRYEELSGFDYLREVEESGEPMGLVALLGTGVLIQGYMDGAIDSAEMLRGCEEMQALAKRPPRNNGGKLSS
jgi:hypothetical protein